MKKRIFSRICEHSEPLQNRGSRVRILLPLPTKNALLSTDKGAFFELSVPRAEREVCFASEAHFVREVCLRHDMRNT